MIQTEPNGTPNSMQQYTTEARNKEGYDNLERKKIKLSSQCAQEPWLDYHMMAHKWLVKRIFEQCHLIVDMSWKNTHVESIMTWKRIFSLNFAAVICLVQLN